MRIGLAFSAFFRVFSDKDFAEGVQALLQGKPALPAETEKPPVPPDAVAVLALLQREGRLVDFLQEDVAGFPDDQVGAIAKQVHEGCRKTLREYVEVVPVLAVPDGDQVTVEPGFDPARIRLVGKVEGDPPFQGVLRHHGWEVKAANLPPASVIVPAEVEIP